MLLWLGALALILTPGVARAQEEDMDFGGGDDPPTADGSGAEEEPAGSSAFVLAFSSSLDDAPIVRELGSALRDVLAAHPRYSTANAENMLNGLDEDAAAALRQAREFFEEGQSAANDLEIEQAIDRFGQALEVYEEQIAHVDDLNDISECLINIGAAHVLAGDSRSSRNFFQRVLVIDPERRPDPDVFPPPVTEAYDQANARLQRVRNGLLNITSETPGAEVYVDGIYQGSAPQELSGFKAGRHYVRVRSQGYVEQGRVIEVSSRRATNLEFDLEPTREGPEATDMLIDLSNQFEEGAHTEAADTVRRLGELLNVEMLATAYVSRGDDGVNVRLNAWDIVGRESVATEQLGPFEADGVMIAGDVQPSFEEMVTSAWAAMNIQQSSDVPLVDIAPPPPPPPVERPVYRRWWFWTVIGVVVVGAGLGVGLGVGLQESPPGVTQGEVIIDL